MKQIPNGCTIGIGRLFRSQYVSGLRMKRRSSSFRIHFSSLLTAETAMGLVPSGLKHR